MSQFVWFTNVSVQCPSVHQTALCLFSAVVILRSPVYFCTVPSTLLPVEMPINSAGPNCHLYRLENAEKSIGDGFNVPLCFNILAILFCCFVQFYQISKWEAVLYFLIVGCTFLLFYTFTVQWIDGYIDTQLSSQEKSLTSSLELYEGFLLRLAALGGRGFLF